MNLSLNTHMTADEVKDNSRFNVMTILKYGQGGFALNLGNTDTFHQKAMYFVELSGLAT